MRLALPILRIDKLSGVGRSTPGTAMEHLTRLRDTSNADPAVIDHNIWLAGAPDLDVEREIDRRLAALDIRPRAGAVLCVGVLLSASPAYFRPDGRSGYGEYDAARLGGFIEAAKRFLTEQFGTRVLCAVVHLDEETPHVQALILPTMPPRTLDKVRLSAKDLFDRGKLISYQDAWEALLRPLGCDPRLKGSRASHVTNKKYHSAAVEVDQEVDAITLALQRLPVLVGEVGADTAMLTRWREEQVAAIEARSVKLAKLAKLGRIVQDKERQNRQLRGRLRDTEDQLRAAQCECDRRIDPDVPRARLSQALGYPLDERPVLIQISLKEKSKALAAARRVAALAGADVAVAAVVEFVRPRMEQAAVLTAESDPAAEETRSFGLG